MKTVICALNAADADQAARALNIAAGDRVFLHQLDRLDGADTFDVTVTADFARRPDAHQAWRDLLRAAERAANPPELPPQPPQVNAVYTTAIDDRAVDALAALIEPFADATGRTVKVRDAARTFAIVLDRLQLADQNALDREGGV
ncbi:hypothetical protein [Actinomadura sp. 3N508]|uniref:hypothetical protein n=1 Tax=Actinomadura sp. 3N508 TaxID=3375153 RepID=UPI0037961C06